jgi:hypothetical protein
MHRSQPLWCWVAYSGCMLLSASFAVTASAQTMAPPAEATPSGFDGFIESALQAYDAGRFAEARTLFRRAHELQPTARTLRTIGMCSFNLGDYVDAVWNLESSLTDTRKPLTEDHRRHASDLIARANPHIGRFRLRLSPADATLSVDGHSPVLLSQTELLLEPGRHEVEVRATGYRPARNVLAVDGGDRTTLELRLTTAPTAAIAESDFSGSPGDNLTAGSGRRQPAASSGSSAQSTIGYVSLGLGAAGLVAFGVISGIAMADKAKLEDKCDTRMCGPT